MIRAVKTAINSIAKIKNRRPTTKKTETLITDILLMLKMYTLDKFPKLQLDIAISVLKIVKKCIHFSMPIS